MIDSVIIPKFPVAGKGEEKSAAMLLRTMKLPLPAMAAVVALCAASYLLGRALPTAAGSSMACFCSSSSFPP